MKAMKHRRGFTLVELIVVVAIIAVLATMAIPMVSGYIADSQEASCAATRESVQKTVIAALVKDSATRSVPTPTFERYTIVFNVMTQQFNCTSTNGALFEGLCPSGGVFSVLNTGSGFPVVSIGEVSVACSVHTGGRTSTGWTKGEVFTAGEYIIINGYVFRCMKTHTSGSRSNTRNPTVKSNKGTWEVVGFVGDPLPYSPTVRYAVGLKVPYNGKWYTRTSYNLTGGQTPYSKSSSRYWTLVEE